MEGREEGRERGRRGEGERRKRGGREERGERMWVTSSQQPDITPIITASHPAYAYHFTLVTFLSSSLLPSLSCARCSMVY